LSSITSQSSVGVIGLGLMGKPMARNLLKAGFPVTVFNRTRAKADDLAAAGARVADSPRDLAAACDVIITNVSDSPDVEAVIAGPGGVLEGLRPASAGYGGALVIDMSTIAASATRRLHDAIVAKGGRMLDAPVSGGDVGAIAGTLSIMVGGAREDFDAAQPVFAALGRTITYCGPSGSGQLVKACNQIVVAIALIAVSEALVFAQKAGVSPDIMIPVLQGGMARTQVMEVRGARMAAGEFKPGFKVALLRKDLNIVLETAKEIGATLPFTRQIEGLLTMLTERGQGELDNSALLLMIQEMSA
jgi:2-hydroxy-3-oxopropionate reductase